MASTNYYIDNSIAGGNGLSPASAYASLSSVAWADGDVAWVRRTHVECANHDSAIFATWSLLSFARVAAAVGWPDSGDPFYDRRPAAGTSAGWDGETPATEAYSTFGYKFPTICGSTTNQNTCPIIGLGFTVANLCFNQLGTSQTFSVRQAVRQSYVNNCLFVRSYSVFNQIPSGASFASMEKFIMPYSTTTGVVFADAGPFDWGHWVVPAVSQNTGPLLNLTTGGSRIKILEIQSNSVALLFGGSAGANILTYNYIQRCVGILPYAGVSSPGQLFSSTGPRTIIDDYYGQGPLYYAGDGKPSWRGNTSLEAMHNGKRSMMFETKSIAAGDHNFHIDLIRYPMIRAMVSVVSGTQINLLLPVYVGSTAVVSLNGIAVKAAMIAAGCRGQQMTDPNSGIIAGSLTNWTGSLVAGGSAWLLKFKFTPTETGWVPFEVYGPEISQANSGTNFKHYTLFSEPYSV